MTDSSTSPGSVAAKKALEALYAVHVPTSLQSPMSEAVALVCKAGVSRSLAAYTCKVDPVGLGITIEDLGLKRAPPANVQKALELIAGGMQREKAERLSDVSRGRAKYWMNRLNVETTRSGVVADAIRDGVANNLTPMEISVKHGICYGSVIRVAGSLGVKLKRQDRYKVTARDQDILDMRKGGAKLHEIGGKYDITPERVRQVLILMERK